MRCSGSSFRATCCAAIPESEATLPDSTDRAMGVATALRAAAEVVGDRPAVIQGDRSVGYAELDARSSRLAGALAERGVGPGSTVAISLYNSFAYLEIMYAVFKLGAQPVNINYRYLAPELHYVLNYTDAGAFVYDTSLAAQVRQIDGDLPKLGLFLEAGSATEPLAPAVSFEWAAEHGPVHEEIDTDSPHGIILLTGGTTGRPKGVVWDRDGLLGIIASVFRQHGLPAPQTPSDVRAQVRGLHERGLAPTVLPMSPLIHGTGLLQTLRSLYGGGTICFCTSKSLNADEVWQTVQQHAVTDMVIVGDAFGRPLVDSLAAAESSGQPYDIRSLRTMTSSGVIWSADVKRRLLRYGADLTLIDNISASEGGPFGMAVARSESDLADGRFTLAPVARILDENDQDVKPGTGQIGILASAGPQPVGYLKDPERTARVWRVVDGVRYSVPGDLASLDADGKLILLGRGDGVINTGGEKVFPEEVEEALLTHPKVTDAVVVGVPDPRWGQIVVAVVAPASALADVGDETLSGLVAERLAGYKRPRRVVRVDSLPRSPAGKINRVSAREVATRYLQAEETAS
ncbi:acyl-CoA synthetase [Nonomuraea longispora]|uniref:Acyl-CoA synthetase n=2 Tax=Nonomuraea longispora TaxID=1848320 RepID=A0A4R4NMT7_9ACTN|nr:acyl-CoA synthetase [Nonomuraea longispora]